MGPELSSVTHSSTPTTASTGPDASTGPAASSGTAATSQPTRTTAESLSAPEISEKATPVTEEVEASPAEAEPEVYVKTVSEDERYAKYFKMLKVGVPLQAVKNKMFQEGLPGDVLDDPDAPAE